MTGDEVLAVQEKLAELEARIEALEAVLLASDEPSLEDQHQEFVARVRSLREQ